MTRMKWITTMMGLGIVISVAVVSIYMPKMVAWYFEPPASIGVSCSPAIVWAFNRFQIVQLASVGFGAVVGLLLGIKLTSKKQPKPPLS